MSGSTSIICSTSLSDWVLSFLTAMYLDLIKLLISSKFLKLFFKVMYHHLLTGDVCFNMVHLIKMPFMAKKLNEKVA